MAILTSKGVKASHQLRGVRKVRISRDRRGSGDVSSIENRVDTLEDDVGDLADLETTAKTDLVSAINEVNGNVEKKNLLWSNPNPTAPMSSQNKNLSISANAKGLLIRACIVTSTGNSVLEGKVYFTANKTASVAISQSYIDSFQSEQYIFGRTFTLNSDHTRLYIGTGSMLTINTDNSTMSVSKNDSFIIPQEIYEIL